MENVPRDDKKSDVSSTEWNNEISISSESAKTTDDVTADIEIIQKGLPGHSEAIQRLLGKVTGLQWDLSIVRALIESNQLIRDYDQVRIIVDNLEAAKGILDIRVGKTYFTLFKVAFHNLNFSNKKLIMQYFYDTYGAAAWHTMDNEMEANMTVIINKMSSSKEKKQFRALAEEFSWFFMMSLRHTWWNLLLTMLRIPAIIPVIVKLLRQLEPVSTFRTNSEKPRLVVAGVRRLLDKKEIVNEEHEANLAQLVTALVSDKIWTVVPMTGQRISSPVKAVIGVSEGLSTMILPILYSNRRLGMNSLALLLENGPESTLDWTSRITVEGGRSGICAVLVYSSILEIFITSSKEVSNEESNMAKLSLHILRLLVTLWQEKGITFPRNEIENIQGRYDTLPWMIRCLVDGYLRPLSEEPIRLPFSECFCDVFKLPVSIYRSVDCDDWTANHPKLPCALKSLFQMATTSMDLISEVIETSSFDQLAEKLKSERLNKPLIEAISHSLASSRGLEPWRRCVDTLTLIYDRLKDESKTNGEESCRLKAYSTGLRAVAPALKLCEALGEMSRKNPSFRPDYVRNFAVVAHEIITPRIVCIEDPLAKHIAWESLLVNTCKVSTLAQSSPEVCVLLTDIVNNVNDEKVKVDKEVINAAANQVTGSAKEVLSKLL